MPDPGWSDSGPLSICFLFLGDVEFVREAMNDRREQEPCAAGTGGAAAIFAGELQTASNFVSRERLLSS
jgi:hypothetical protein